MTTKKLIESTATLHSRTVHEMDAQDFRELDIVDDATQIHFQGSDGYFTIVHLADIARVLFVRNSTEVVVPKVLP